MYGWRRKLLAVAEGFSSAFLVVSRADLVALLADSVKDLDAMVDMCWTGVYSPILSVRIYLGQK